MASLNCFFNFSKLKLAHINTRSCRNKRVEIMIDREGEGDELLSLCVIILNSISLKSAPY